MIKDLIIFFILIEFTRAFFVSDRAVDLKTNSRIRNDIKLEIIDDKFDGSKFPDRFLFIKDGLEIDFVKRIKRGQNAHGIFFIGEDNKLNKEQEPETKNLQEYIEMLGDNFLILIREDQGNSGEFFRITGKIELGGIEEEIDVIPIFTQNKNRHKRSMTEPIHGQIKKDNKISVISDQNIPQSFLSLKVLEDLRKKVILENIRSNKSLRVNKPVELDVEILVVTDQSIFMAHRAFLRTTRQSLIMSYMQIYYSHVINNVNKLFQNSFSNDPDLRINVKASNFIFLTRQMDSRWSDRFFAGDSRISMYNNRRVILGSKALELFKSYTDGVNLNFDHAIAFINHDIWHDSSVSTNNAVRSSATGFSYFNGICSEYKYSVVEDFGAFTNIQTTAHHLARNLGASFDSFTDINCLADEYYIMSPLLNSTVSGLKHKLSECSVRELKKILISNGQASSIAQCLTNPALAFNLVTEKNNLTGLFFGANDQCKMIHGSAATFVQHFAENMCSQMYCRKTNNDFFVFTSGPAAEGTICGSGKICQSGKCEPSNRVEPNECPFEDEPIQNIFSSISLPTAHVSCSEYFGYLNRAGISISSFCSSTFSYSCCRSCLPHKASPCQDKNFYCPFYQRYCSFFTQNGDRISDICPLTCSNCPRVSCPTNRTICQNGGTCVSRLNSQLTCSCRREYSGPICEKKDPCVPNPCKNSGICYTAGENSYVCECPSSFIGDDCSILNVTIASTTTQTTRPTSSLNVVTSTQTRTTTSSTRSTTTQTTRPTSSLNVVTSTQTRTTTSSTRSTTTQTTRPTSTSSSVQPIPGVTNIGTTCMLGQNHSFCDVCGRQFVEPNVRIVGGIDAKPNSWPSIGLLVFNYETLFTFQGNTYRLKLPPSYCGSSLIDRNTVLTAAHCYIKSYFVDQFGITLDFENDPNFPSNAYKVYLGLHSNKGIFDGTANLTGVTVVSVKNFKMHENYDENTFMHDIAILKLEREVDFNSAVQPVCLPPNLNYRPTTNTRAWIAGWGTLSFRGEMPSILQNTFITYYHSGFECRNIGQLNFTQQICAGEIDGGKDSCQGDSGGPLYILDKNTFVQVGITSFGIDCALPGYPGIYARVAAYVDWIVKNI